MSHFEKFAIISDTHYGDVIFPEDEKTRLTKEFFKIVREQNIKTIVHLGDVFDTAFGRKNMIFFDEIQDEKVYCLAGNHDFEGVCERVFQKFPDNVVTIARGNEIHDGSLFLPAQGYDEGHHFPIEIEHNTEYQFAHASELPDVYCGHFHNKKNRRMGSAWAFNLYQTKIPKGFHIIENGNLSFIELKTEYWSNQTDLLSTDVLDLAEKDILDVPTESLRQHLKIYMGWEWNEYDEKDLDAITETIRYWRTAPKSEQEKIGALWKLMKSRS